MCRCYEGRQGFNLVVSFAPLCLELVRGTVCLIIAKDPEFFSWAVESQNSVHAFKHSCTIFSLSPGQSELSLYTFLRASWTWRGSLVAVITVRHTSNFHLSEIIRAIAAAVPFQALLIIHVGFSCFIRCTLSSEVLKTE